MNDAHRSPVVLAGLLVGVFVGLGGTSGALLIPTLVFVFGFSQIKVQARHSYRMHPV